MRFRPDPDESAFLVPPRHPPPTAVGTATPEPPEPHMPSGAYPLFSRVQRVAAGLLGTAMLGGGIALVTGPFVLAPLGVLFLYGSVKALTVSATGLDPRGYLRLRRMRRNANAARKGQQRRAA